MKFLVYPHYVAVHYKPEPDLKTVMIRVLEPTGENEELIHANAFTDVLSVYFDDLTQDMIVGLPNPERFRLISKDDAFNIAQFFIKHLDADVFIIHCHAGVSRSQAIALAFARFLDFEKMAETILEKYPIYNRDVYEEVTRALMKLI